MWNIWMLGLHKSGVTVPNYTPRAKHLQLRKVKLFFTPFAGTILLKKNSSKQRKRKPGFHSLLYIICVTVGKTLRRDLISSTVKSKGWAQGQGLGECPDFPDSGICLISDSEIRSSSHLHNGPRGWMLCNPGHKHSGRSPLCSCTAH